MDETTPKIDLDETPQSRHRKSIVRKSAVARKKIKTVDVWFEQRANKIVKKTKMSNGSVKSEFVGLVTKKNADAIALLKKNHTFKVV